MYFFMNIIYIFSSPINEPLSILKTQDVSETDWVSVIINTDVW